MDNLTSALAIKALDGLTQRATVTAENIANANTPGYRPLRVTFESALAAAAMHGTDAVEAVKPIVDRDPGPESVTGVRLDLQLATASATALRFAALIEILHRRGQIDDLANARNA